MNRRCIQGHVLIMVMVNMLFLTSLTLLCSQDYLRLFHSIKVFYDRFAEESVLAHRLGVAVQYVYFGSAEPAESRFLCVCSTQIKEAMCDSPAGTSGDKCVDVDVSVGFVDPSMPSSRMSFFEAKLTGPLLRSTSMRWQVFLEKNSDSRFHPVYYRVTD